MENGKEGKYLTLPADIRKDLYNFELASLVPIKIWNYIHVKTVNTDPSNREYDVNGLKPNEHWGHDSESRRETGGLSEFPISAKHIIRVRFRSFCSPVMA
jgi:hypothetical protein